MKTRNARRASPLECEFEFESGGRGASGGDKARAFSAVFLWKAWLVQRENPAGTRAAGRARR